MIGMSEYLYDLSQTTPLLAQFFQLLLAFLVLLPLLFLLPDEVPFALQDLVVDPLHL